MNEGSIFLAVNSRSPIKILLQDSMIQSLPFGKLHTLKHLNIISCFSIRVLQLEQLPSRLERLKIANCDYLELITGDGYQDNLSLEIIYCGALKLITRHTESHIGRQRVSSLPRLKIERCDLLRVQPLKRNRQRNYHDL